MLNQGPYRNAKIIVAGDNFGCGSSREHAPWALMDFGIIAASSRRTLADIFYNNCFKNGLLPIALPKEIVDQSDGRRQKRRGQRGPDDRPPKPRTISRPDGGVVHFDIDPFRKHCLVNGLDDIGLTEQKGAEIATYETVRRGAPRLGSRHDPGRDVTLPRDAWDKSGGSAGGF